MSHPTDTLFLSAGAMALLTAALWLRFELRR